MTSERPDRSVSPAAFVARLLERAVREFFSSGGPHLAGAIAYRVLFSLFPLAIVLTGIFGIVLQITGLQADAVDAIVKNVPLSEQGRSDLRSLLKGATGNLSGLGLLGLVGLAWAASGMMAAIRYALNRAWNVEERRPFLQGKAVDLLLVVGVAVLVLLSLGLAVGSRLVARYADQSLAWTGLGGGAFTWLLGVLAPFILTSLAVGFVYHVVPASRPPLRTIWLPALLVGVVFALFQNLFALYVDHFGNYNAVYGSIGAIIAFLFFVYVSSSVFLFGAQLAAHGPPVRRELETGVEKGSPLSEQIVGFLKGLAVRTTGDPDTERPGCDAGRAGADPDSAGRRSDEAAAPTVPPDTTREPRPRAESPGPRD